LGEGVIGRKNEKGPVGETRDENDYEGKKSNSLHGGKQKGGQKAKSSQTRFLNDNGTKKLKKKAAEDWRDKGSAHARVQKKSKTTVSCVARPGSGKGQYCSEDKRAEGKFGREKGKTMVKRWRLHNE